MTCHTHTHMHRNHTVIHTHCDVNSSIHVLTVADNWQYGRCVRPMAELITKKYLGGRRVLCIQQIIFGIWPDVYEFFRTPVLHSKQATHTHKDNLHVSQFPKIGKAAVRAAGRAQRRTELWNTATWPSLMSEKLGQPNKISNYKDLMDLFSLRCIEKSIWGNTGSKKYNIWSWGPFKDGLSALLQYIWGFMGWVYNMTQSVHWCPRHNPERKIFLFKSRLQGWGVFTFYLILYCNVSN